MKQFIDSCLQAGGKVLIHGNSGASRSAALLASYIMETLLWYVSNIFSRFLLLPKVHQVKQLNLSRPNDSAFPQMKVFVDNFTSMNRYYERDLEYQKVSKRQGWAKGKNEKTKEIERILMLIYK